MRLMNSLSTAKSSQSSPDSASANLNVLLLYEDFGCGLRARRGFEQTVRQLDLLADFNISLWRFDLLWNPGIRDQALHEATLAELIFVSAHGQTELPAQVHLWLESWLIQKPAEPGALVLSLDAEHQASATATRMISALQAIAGPAGVEVFPHFGTSPTAEEGLAAENLHRRAVTRTTVLDNILTHPEYPSHWGINE